MPHKAHFVINPGVNGEALQSPLKPWVRQNLAQLPNNFYDDDDTSHILRRKLRQIGWRLNMTDTAVFVIKPDNNGQFDYAENLVEEIIEDEEVEITNDDDSFEITFSLEKDLQAALRRNIETLELGLKIIDNGKERNTIAGRIDITAEDDLNKIVVIELKAIEAKPDVIAQTLSYMEAVKDEDKKEVRGIIIASSFTERVKLAARQIPQLKLVQYSFQFNFTKIE